MYWTKHLKRNLPRSLFGRSILILAVPIVFVQMVVTVIFIDRFYGDVTIAKTNDIIREINYIFAPSKNITPDLFLQDIKEKSNALAITVEKINTTIESNDKIGFDDISGKFIIETIRRNLSGIIKIDLHTDKTSVLIWLKHTPHTYLIKFDRRRVSASNPHQLLVATTLTALLFITIAVLFLRNQIRPIRNLATATQAFGTGRKISFKPSGAAEVRQAGHAFLAMQKRIEQHIENRTLMLSGISHDLRTPLTRMKLLLTIHNENEYAQELLDDVNKMECIINEFLAFSRGNSSEKPCSFKISEILDDIYKNSQKLGTDITLQKPLTPKIIIWGKKIALTRALQNIIQNAEHFATKIHLSVQHTDTEIIIHCNDNGPGIPEDKRHLAIQPFVCLDKARTQNQTPGTGLGLAIATDIIHGHGGKMNLNHSKNLGGLRVEIRLPRQLK